jgi:hypothetical protein
MRFIFSELANKSCGNADGVRAFESTLAITVEPESGVIHFIVSDRLTILTPSPVQEELLVEFVGLHAID